MRFKSLTAKPVRLIALGMILAGMATPAAAIITISSGAYNVSVDLRILSIPLLTVGPVGSVSDSAGGPGNDPAYSINTNPTALNVTLGTLLDLGVTTGVLNLQAVSPLPLTPTGSASASTANLNLGLVLDPIIGASTNLLTIGATEIRSTSSVEGFGGPSASGSSFLSGLTFGGSLLGGNTINGSLFVNPAANTNILTVGSVLQIIANEQIVTGSSLAGSAGITTNALRVRINTTLVGLGLVSGDIIISQSRANYFNDNPSFVPEPAVWLQLIVGFGAVGAITRRRRALIAARA